VAYYSWEGKGLLTTDHRKKGNEAFPSVPRLPAWSFFCDLSAGDSCPLRIPLDKLGAAASPTDKSQKDGGFHQSLQKNPHYP